MQLRGTILQPWNWYTPARDDAGAVLWQRLARDATGIKKAGYTAVWLPPASKAHTDNDVGYGIQDWYTLDGTKYGDKFMLRTACEALQKNGLSVYHDQVFNHLMGGEPEGDVWCLSVKKNNKAELAAPDCVWFQATINTHFPHLGMNHHHFDAYHPNDHECWILSNKTFDCEAIQDAWGGCDLDYDSPYVVQKLESFGNWFRNEIPLDGYRFDAVKHIRPKGTLNYLTAMRWNAERNYFAVAELLDDRLNILLDYIHQTMGQMSLFDVPLQRKLCHASQAGRHFDMRGLNNDTLTSRVPYLSVPFVHSHDDMPPMHNHEGRGHWVGDWFISQAYAMTLLRDEGYPMVADVDAIRHENMIKRYMLVRTHCTYGHREDRFDHPNTVGWSFHGASEYDNSCAVVMTNNKYGRKWLPTGKPNTPYRDFTDALSHTIWTNGDGWAEFECPDGNTSVWVEEGKYHSLVGLL